tara:strand:+ start:1824 stop:2624 length:801 start_codon:yes stop_codon:yes gene_type:complete
MQNKKIFIFTDLDGSLLHSETFDFDIIKDFIIECHKSKIVIVLNSSKTKKEIEVFLDELGLKLPFIVENGSAIYGLSLLGDHLPKTKVLSKSKNEVWKIFEKNFNKNIIMNFKFLNNLKDQEISTILNLTLNKVKNAMNRKYTIPFIFLGDEIEKNLIINKASSIGLSIQEGGRIMTLGDKFDKSDAMLEFIKYFNQDTIISIGIGDNKNDLTMLDSSDFPCLIKNINFNYTNTTDKNYILSSSPAPEGWREVVEEVLIKIDFFEK